MFCSTKMAESKKNKAACLFFYVHPRDEIIFLHRTLTWICWAAASGGTRFWLSFGSSVGSVDSSIKGFWESGSTGLKLSEMVSSSINHKIKKIIIITALSKPERFNGCKVVMFRITGCAAFPVALNQLLHPADQLPPHIVKQQVQNGLTATPVRWDGRQTVVPSNRLQTVLVTLVISVEEKNILIVLF